uniref:Uncharacterized protein n=1 Tax=Knipowitschia caucasica TaxID=637954 RepID=A0AAV2KFS7_KNICA
MDFKSSWPLRWGRGRGVVTVTFTVTATPSPGHPHSAECRTQPVRPMGWSCESVIPVRMASAPHSLAHTVGSLRLLSCLCDHVSVCLCT